MHIALSWGRAVVRCLSLKSDSVREASAGGADGDWRCRRRQGGTTGPDCAEYRSLLVNAASTFSYDAVVAASVQQTGAGLLNVLSAARSTVAVAPVVANFGTGGSSPRQTLALDVMNFDGAEDTISVRWRISAPVPFRPCR